MHNSESLLENETHKNPRDFEIKKYHRFSVRRPDIVIVTKKRKKKKERVNYGFAIPADPIVNFKKSKLRAS